MQLNGWKGWMDGYGKLDWMSPADEETMRPIAFDCWSLICLSTRRAASDMGYGTRTLYDAQARKLKKRRGLRLRKTITAESPACAQRKAVHECI